MLGIIRRALARRKLSERELFRFHDGQQVRYGDPFRIYRSIINDQRIDIAREQPLIDAGSEPETTKALAVLCDAFGVTQWDGETGLSDWEILALLTQFTDYMEALKKNGNESATLSPTTDSTFSNSPVCPSAATSSYLPSNSMPNESPSAEATETSWPSAPELASPSESH